MIPPRARANARRVPARNPPCLSRAWCSGILCGKGYFDVLAVVIETIPLHNVQLLRVWCPKAVDRNAVDEPDRVNNQCISILVMANGFYVDRKARIPAVRHVQ